MGTRSSLLIRSAGGTRRREMLPDDIVWIDGESVQMQPYILPHHSRLSATEYDYYQNRSDFISNQGAYIYRNGRLMAWGDWFRLIPKGEATKLAAFRSTSRTASTRWTIDIKKSRARPPRRCGSAAADHSRIAYAGASTIVHRGRGQKLFRGGERSGWERYADHGRHPLCRQRWPSSSGGASWTARADDIDALEVVLELLARQFRWR